MAPEEHSFRMAAGYSTRQAIVRLHAEQENLNDAEFG
jgi:hypothetical protein